MKIELSSIGLGDMISHKDRTQERNIWYEMKRRCNDPTRHNYKYYGGRGIKVCQRWQGSFDAFYDDMGARPEGHSIDRVDNSGNYDPNNCRWATMAEQTANRRPRPNKHGVTGVSLSNGRYMAQFHHKYLGSFATLDEAASAYQRARLA